MKEWISFWNNVAKALPNHPARQLWASILKFKNLEFPNLCLHYLLLAKLIIAISGSNSAGEQSFSTFQSAYAYAVRSVAEHKSRSDEDKAALKHRRRFLE